MPTPQRLPIVNSDDGVWGDIIRQYITKEHFNDDTDNVANGGHHKITIRAGTASAGTAPLKFTSGTLLTTPEAGAIEFNADKLYFTKTTGPTRQTVAAYDVTGATGDLYYRDASSNFTRLPVGSTNNVLTVSGGLPTWSAPVVTSTFSDVSFFLQDNGDTTKQAQFQLSGITTGTTRTITVPNSNGTMYVTGGTDVSVADGGTGRSTSTTAYGIIAAGTTATGAQQTIAPGTSGQFLKSAGASALASFASLIATDISDSTSVGRSVLTATDAASARTAIGAGTGSGDVTLTGTQTLTSKTLTSPIINGTVTGTATATTPAADLLAKWDTNKNLFADNFIATYTSTPTAANTTTLTVASTQIQVFTGTTTQIVSLPTTSVVAGTQFRIINNSTGAVTVNASGGTTAVILAANTSTLVTALQAAPTTNAHWDTQYWGAAVASGKTLTVSQSLTLAGTDGTTMTFPGASDTVVGLAAAQTLVNKTLTTPTIASFTNATHNHTNAAGGGQLTASTAISATGTPSSSTYLRGDNTWSAVATGDTSTNTATSVANEVALFADATGKMLKRATGSGIATLTSGVLSATATTGSGNVVLATSPTLVTPALGTPSSVMLTNATGLPVSGITASTSTALGVGSLELGHATDTTLSRSSAGVLAVEGIVVPTISSGDTLTNKTMSGTNNTFSNIPQSAVTGLATDFSKLVCTTANGGIGTEDGANTWAKIATFSTGTNQFSECQLILTVTNGSSANHATALVSVYFRTNATSSNPTVDVGILAKGGTGAGIVATHLRLSVVHGRQIWSFGSKKAHNIVCSSSMKRLGM